jgi:DNA-binding GntR family transcriptional regulator
MIMEGQIAAGEKLHERTLCAQLGVSRTPLREAIKLLASEGLVHLVPNRGAVAAKLDEAAVQSAYEVLSALEGLAGQLAAQRITDEEIDEIRALHFEMMASFSRRNIVSYFKFNAAIHNAINLAARNPVLTAMYRTVNSRVAPVRLQSNFDEAKWARAVKEHEKIIEALLSRDATALQSLMSQHFKSPPIHGAERSQRKK